MPALPINIFGPGTNHFNDFVHSRSIAVLAYLSRSRSTRRVPSFRLSIRLSLTSTQGISRSLDLSTGLTRAWELIKSFRRPLRNTWSGIWWSLTPMTAKLSRLLTFQSPSTRAQVKLVWKHATSLDPYLRQRSIQIPERQHDYNALRSNYDSMYQSMWCTSLVGKK